MIKRCHDSGDRAFKDYGARGILVCDEWRSSFKTFLADMGESGGLEIDRRRNNDGYSPGNCRWTDRLTQMNNIRSNVFIEHNGIRQTLSQWSRETGIGITTLWRRHARGLPAEDVLSTFDLHLDRNGARIKSR